MARIRHATTETVDDGAIGRDDWRWRNRVGHGAGFWPNQFNIGNVTVAASGNGNIAIASNPVFISSGVWHWPGHTNAGGWFWHHGLDNGQWRWPPFCPGE